MGTGAITGYVDVAQLVLYAFWIFFFALIYYLQRESKREGFPLESDLPSGGTLRTPGIVGMPPVKTYLLHDGTRVSVPRPEPKQVPLAVARHGWIGAPLEPTGHPMLDGVGPGAYANRADVPDLNEHGLPKIIPLRLAVGFEVSDRDNDPRGMAVYGDDGEVGGTVVDLWVDQMEMMFRYLEVEVPVAGGTRRVLVPMNFARIKRDGVTVHSVLAHQLADVPALKSDQQITFLEEEKVMAYFGAGTLYAEPSRSEPLV